MITSFDEQTMLTGLSRERLLARPLTKASPMEI
jgi:hypothetical protein